MSKQISLVRSGNINTGTAYFSPMGGNSIWQTTEFIGTYTCPTAGVFSNLKVDLISAPSAGKSVAFTFRKNGSDQTLTCTISDTATGNQDITHSVSVVAGDRISIKAVGTGTPTVSNAQISIDFTPTVAGESMYGGISGSNIALTRSTGALYGDDTGNWGGDVSVVAIPGTVSAIYLTTSGDPTPGSYVCNLYKNGVKQDGTGGTTNTTTTVASGGTTGNSSFSLSVVAGDTLRIEAVPTSSPTARQLSFGLKFAATNANKFMMGNNPSTVGPTGAQGTNYWIPNGSIDTTFTATEGNTRVKAGITGLKVSALYIAANISPGGSGVTFNLLKSGSSTPFSVAVASGATSGNDTSGNANFSNGDFMSMEFVPTASVVARSWSWTMEVEASGGGGNGNPKGGGKGPGKGPSGIQIFGLTDYQMWDSVMAFGQ